MLKDYGSGVVNVMLSVTAFAAGLVGRTVSKLAGQYVNEFGHKGYTWKPVVYALGEVKRS
tara:strand:- start:2365 stop:2544 length:180 start_codon:yes stop_codon:yes gene_type:complete